jgi:flagellar protein FlaF
MGKSQLAAAGYASNGENVKDFRAQEYDVIIAVTRDLSRLQNDTSASFADIVNVVHKNERLWITIGAQVASDANALPQNLRANLLYIAKFVSHHTNMVLKKNGDLGILVDLNVSVLRGLKGTS